MKRLLVFCIFCITFSGLKCKRESWDIVKNRRIQLFAEVSTGENLKLGDTLQYDRQICIYLILTACNLTKSRKIWSLKKS
jgi:hypothetical protein